MNNKLKAFSFVLNMLLGAFMFVFGGADDSPGAQLLGMIAIVTGVVGLINLMRENRTSN